MAASAVVYVATTVRVEEARDTRGEAEIVTDVRAVGLAGVNPTDDATDTPSLDVLTVREEDATAPAAGRGARKEKVALVPAAMEDEAPSVTSRVVVAPDTTSPVSVPTTPAPDVTA